MELIIMGTMAVRVAGLSSSCLLKRCQALSSLQSRPSMTCYRHRSSAQSHQKAYVVVGEKEETPASKRRQFKALPVHPSILQYIQMIGVGISPRSSSKGRRRRDGAVASPQRSRHRRNQQQQGGTAQSRRPSWKPPPPFGPDSLPVQILKSVGVSGEKSSAGNSKFPINRNRIAEVALVGRSNVGKSTLLNTLLYGNRTDPSEQQQSRNNKGRSGRRLRTVTLHKLPKGCKATTSPRPGETRSITFYKLKHKQEQETRQLILVDLPGYGFSFASEKDVAGFSKLMSNYLLLRDSKLLKRVLLLIDARHGMKKADIDFLDMLQDEVSLRKRQQQQGDGKSSQAVTLPPLQIVLTKCDLVTQADLARRVSLVRQQLSDCLRREPSAAGLPVMLVSTRAINATASILQGDRPVTGGVLELQKELASLAVPRRNADS